MREPLIPSDELERLTSLRSLAILDTPPEERFDRVTRMAKRLFDVPIALVSLIDENRQWFKSCMGLDVNETERRISFCGHAIVENGTFVIENALEDERFFDNPLVTGEPNIRFYAGQPLRTLSGQGLGTLCIIDKKPRNFDSEDYLILSDLARMVEREIMAVHLSINDELTRISNRRGFLTLTKYSLDVCKRQLFPATLIYLDLDDFKAVNDTYGHNEGDRALKLFANQMRESFRTCDIFARVGGDEFVLLLTNSDPSEAANIIEKFKLAIERQCAEYGLPYVIRFSWGQVQYEPLKHTCIEDMLHEADSAMYVHKSTKDQELH